MARRRFDHLVLELSLALDRPAPRYRLWLCLHEHGADPEDLSREQALHFCGAPLERFLEAEGLRLPARARLRLRRAVHRYDPSHPTPEEQLARL